MTPRERVINELTAYGWQPDGTTPTETVRVPTVEAPIFGGIGGKVVTTGGRQRFARPGTNYRVTVGKRTTFFYRVVKGGTEAIAHLRTTGDVEQIMSTIKELSKPTPFEEATEYVSFVVDDAQTGRELGADPHAIVTEKSILVGWQCGFEPLFVAVNSYLDVTLSSEEAEELAIDYLKDRKWFSDPDADNFATYIIRHDSNPEP